jgi:arylsulfatase A-like enzyme
MTGRYPITTGNQFHLVLPQIPWGLNLTEVLFPEILKSHGNYATAAVGKWHLGHHDTAYLPTNRGFDQFSGYLLGQIYPWSKTSAADSSYYDSIYADTDCYAVYNLSDTTEFTTFLYTKQAVRIIEKHDFDSQPLYLYLSLQAVHEPFSDLTMFQDGIPASYIGQATYDELQARFPGKTRFEYALSLLLADRAIETVYNSVVAQGVLDNTYFVIASDNGGCQLGGGRNGDLRGAKGTLYEGGLKVDALIHSPLLPSSTRGSNYSNLFHVSDWFPTLTSFLGIDYTPTPDHAFDGVDHSSMILNWGSDDTSLTASPRTSLIYNIYYNIYDTTFDDDQYPYAVRDEQYKLLRTYTNNTLSDYYDFSSVYDNDDDLTRCQCNQDQAVLGDSEHYLYDLINDPNETNNLYYSTDPTYVAVKQKLEAMITERLSSIAYDTYGSVVADDDAYTVWENHDDYIIPWSYSGNVKYCTPKTDFI